MLNGAQQQSTGGSSVTGGGKRDTDADGKETVMLAFCLNLFLVITSARTTIIEQYIPDVVENTFEIENAIPARLDRQRSESSGLIPLSTTMSEKMLNPERLVPTSTRELCIETFLVFPAELTHSESICKILEDPLLSTIFMEIRLDYTKRCILLEEHILTFEPANNIATSSQNQNGRSGPSLFGPFVKISNKEQETLFFRGIHHHLESLPASRLCQRLKQHYGNLNVNILVSVRDGTREDVLGFDDTVLDSRQSSESYLGYSPAMTVKQSRGNYTLSSRYLQDPMKIYKQIHRLLFTMQHELNPKPPARLSVGFWLWPLPRSCPRRITTSSNESESESSPTPGGAWGRRRLPFLRHSRSLRSLRDLKSPPSPPPSAPLNDDSGRSSSPRKEKDEAIGRYGLEVFRRSNKGTQYLRQAFEVRSLWAGASTTDLTASPQPDEPNGPSGRGGPNESSGAGPLGEVHDTPLVMSTEQDKPLRRSMIFVLRRSSSDSAVSMILQLHQPFAKRRSYNSFTSTAVASSIYTRSHHSLDYSHAHSSSIAEVQNEDTYDFKDTRHPDFACLAKHGYTPPFLGNPDPSLGSTEETGIRPPSPYRLSSASSITTATYFTAKSCISASIIPPDHTSVNFPLPFSDNTTTSRDVDNNTQIPIPIPPTTPAPNITPTNVLHHAGILTEQDHQNYLYNPHHNQHNHSTYHINFIFQGDTFSAPIYGGVVGGRSNHNIHNTALQASSPDNRTDSRSAAVHSQIEAILAQICNYEPTVQGQHSQPGSQPQSQSQPQAQVQG